MPGRKRRIKHGAIVEAFAERLRLLRLARGMTQRDLAARANVTLSYISRLESGGAAPGIDLLERLAVALQVQLTDLLPEPAKTPSLEAQRLKLREQFSGLLP